MLNCKLPASIVNIEKLAKAQMHDVYHHGYMYAKSNALIDIYVKHIA